MESCKYLLRIVTTSLSNTIHTTHYDPVRLSEPHVFNTITKEADFVLGLILFSYNCYVQ